MGIATLKVQVSTMEHPERKTPPLDLLVDTGSTVTMIPREALSTLDSRVIGSMQLETADGTKIERPFANLLLHFTADGTEETAPTRVLLAEKRDAALLGVPVLEMAGYAVDPVRKTLIKVGGKALHACQPSG